MVPKELQIRQPVVVVSFMDGHEYDSELPGGSLFQDANTHEFIDFCAVFVKNQKKQFEPPVEIVASQLLQRCVVHHHRFFKKRRIGPPVDKCTKQAPHACNRVRSVAIVPCVKFEISGQVVGVDHSKHEISRAYVCGSIKSFQVRKFQTCLFFSGYILNTARHTATHTWTPARKKKKKMVVPVVVALLEEGTSATFESMDADCLMDVRKGIVHVLSVRPNAFDVEIGHSDVVGWDRLADVFVNTVALPYMPIPLEYYMRNVFLSTQYLDRDAFDTPFLFAWNLVAAYKMYAVHMYDVIGDTEAERIGWVDRFVGGWKGVIESRMRAATGEALSNVAPLATMSLMRETTQVWREGVGKGQWDELVRLLRAMYAKCEPDPGLTRELACVKLDEEIGDRGCLSFDAAMEEQLVTDANIWASRGGAPFGKSGDCYEAKCAGLSFEDDRDGTRLTKCAASGPR